MQFAEENDAIFYTVSAYSGAGIDELFEHIGTKCLNLSENENLKNSIKLDKKNVNNTQNNNNYNNNNYNYNYNNCNC